MIKHEIRRATQRKDWDTVQKLETILKTNRAGKGSPFEQREIEMANEQNRRRGMIAKIKVAQKQLGMDDDVYRDVLAAATGLRSCKDMEIWQLERVLQKMERLGFAPTRGKPERQPLHLVEHTPMINKMGALLHEMGKSWAYAHGIARKMFGVETVQRCDGEQMRKVLAALNYQAKREAHKAA